MEVLMAVCWFLLMRTPGLGSESVAGIATNRTLTLAFLAPWERGWTAGPYMGSAIVVGIREVTRRQLLPGYQIEFLMRDDYCEPRRGTQMIIDMWASVDDLDAVIGPGCSVVCQPASLLAAAWGIPIVSFSCSVPTLSDKPNNPTFTRVVYSDISKAVVFEPIANLFGWNRIGIISTTEELHREMSKATMKDLESKGKEVVLQFIDTTVKGKLIDMEKLQTLRMVMELLKTKARIFILNCYGADMRNILIMAHDVGMLNGDYAFFTAEYVLTIMDLEQTYRPELDDIIYDGLLAVGVRVPSGENWDKFRQDVIEAFQLPIFDHVPHLPASASIDDVNVYAGNLHDAVLCWAYGVNRTLREGFPPDDGFRITKNIINMTFEGITGTVALDKNGDRKLNLRLIIVQGSEHVLLMEWNSTLGRMEKVYKPEDAFDWSGIHWHGNGTHVPYDKPSCGWNGELCTKEIQFKKTVIIITTISSVSILVLTCILVYYVKRQLFESKLRFIEEITIKWSDLGRISRGTRAASQSTFASEITSNSRRNTRNSELELFHYKELVVLVKRLSHTPLNLKDAEVFSDLKSMRELAHANINSFVGICNELPNVSYFMEYAPRGTLQDILSNGDVQLSKDFKISFIRDIAYGMWYLLQSPVQVHGRLTSGRCVVDKRWTCKVTGHGLNYIRNKYVMNTQEDHNMLHDLLWMSPEKLNNVTGLSTSILQKADVFSFAIICQEVFLQDVPYSANIPELDAGQIIEKVKKADGAPYRPEIPEGYCSTGWMELIQQCWDQEPENRPSFSEILATINKIQKYKNLELVDSMLKRLEKHTRDLEEKVNLRSRELLGEKGKVEALLSELLPASVSAKLARGEPVPPEAFENVTIFFSDIVGFTRISAAASPMDIVAMLNRMYTMFDDIALAYDVYKVATIGDAYMVASGVPRRNADRHAAEICGLSVALLRASRDLTVPHLPGEHLLMRVGIHSGPCVAGVCGLKMPRYLLFGDTVEIAAKLEAGGQPMKIHVSDATYSMVKAEETFAIETRGQLEIKGKGSFITYWLTSKNQ